MRKGWVSAWAFFLVFLLLLPTAGCDRKEDTNAGERSVVPVTLAEVTKGRLTKGDILSGKVGAGAEVSLAPKIAGKVGAVYVNVGSPVRAGQVVLRLDAPELAAGVRQAAAGVRQAEAALVLAESNLRQAQMDYEVAAANWERAKVLLEHEALAEAEFQAKYELPYKAAKERAEKLAPAQVRQAEAGVCQAEAALALAKANLANSVLTSPLDGFVTVRNVDPGEMASPTMPILTIVNIDKVAVEAGVSEWQVNRLKMGQKVKVFIAAAQAEPFEGIISNLSPAADPRTKNYTVKVEIPNPQHLIKPGMFAEIDLGVAEEAVLVPRDAVVTRDNTSVVFIVKENKAVRRKVETGASDGRNIAIKQGLKPGERVVVSGQHRLTDRTKVQVVEDEA